jgi:O-ureido-D-serine cyclo-ligase
VTAPRAPKVALVTAKVVQPPDDDPDMEPSLAALREQGIDALAACWDDPDVQWAAFDLVVLRSTWDYVERYEEFFGWLAHAEAQARVLNPPSVVRWSADKRYLQDLEARAIPVVPTVFIEPGAPISLPSWDGDLVVKPSIGAGAKDAARHASADEAKGHVRKLAARGRTAMVQPYLAAIEEHGETGLVYFNGELSHAFEKAPLLDAGRSRPDGLFAHETITERTPRDSELALADSVIAAFAKDLLYARVDLVPGQNGEPVVLEVELAEPSFFLHSHDGAAQAFARAVKERLTTGSRSPAEASRA